MSTELWGSTHSSHTEKPGYMTSDLPILCSRYGPDSSISKDSACRHTLPILTENIVSNPTNQMRNGSSERSQPTTVLFCTAVQILLNITTSSVDARRTPTQMFEGSQARNRDSELCPVSEGSASRVPDGLHLRFSADVDLSYSYK